MFPQMRGLFRQRRTLNNRTQTSVSLSTWPTSFDSHATMASIKIFSLAVKVRAAVEQLLT